MNTPTAQSVVWLQLRMPRSSRPHLPPYRVRPCLGCLPGAEPPLTERVVVVVGRMREGLGGILGARPHSQTQHKGPQGQRGAESVAPARAARTRPARARGRGWGSSSWWRMRPRGCTRLAARCTGRASPPPPRRNRRPLVHAKLPAKIVHGLAPCHQTRMRARSESGARFRTTRRSVARSSDSRRLGSQRYLNALRPRWVDGLRSARVIPMRARGSRILLPHHL